LSKEKLKHENCPRIFKGKKLIDNESAHDGYKFIDTEKVSVMIYNEKMMWAWNSAESRIPHCIDLKIREIYLLGHENSSFMHLNIGLWVHLALKSPFALWSLEDDPCEGSPEV